MHRKDVLLCGLAVCSAVFVRPATAQAPGPTYVTKLGIEMDVRSGARILADDFLSGNVILPDAAPPMLGPLTVPQIQFRGGNIQVNNPSGDYVQTFPGFRPFVRATQSEVSTAAFGSNIVVTYNDSTGIHVLPNPSGPGLIVDKVLLSGFAVSNDGGRTWKRGFMPPAPKGEETFGDPSVGVDRVGNFYFANLGLSAAGHATIQVNTSKDGGNTFGPAVVVQEDDGSDKEWLAVGPDPVHRNQDNVYITWTSFQTAACELRFGRSTDGGTTFTAKTIFVPTADPNPSHPQNCLTFSNVAVDSVTGTIYIPFLHFSNADQDFIQMMISDDAGETFRFATFNIPGAPNPTVMPVTQPGALTACGGGNIRLTVHTSANAGPGVGRFPRYINASRLILQPSLAARNGRLYMAWNNSSTLVYGDQTSRSNILFVSSNDGGKTWSDPITVNPQPSTDLQHVLPSLALDQNPLGVHITYYTQNSNGTIDLDMANSLDGGATFPANRTIRVTGTSFNLPPTNIPLSNAPSYNATNYDRQIAVCYALGEYQGVTTANGSVYAAWGDARSTLTEPISSLNPISGQTHSEQNVMFQQVKAQ